MPNTSETHRLHCLRRMPRLTLLTFWALFAALSLTACGGGGGDNGGGLNTVSNPPIVIEAVPGPPSGTVSYPYDGFTFIVESSGSPSSWTWTLASGPLPKGLILGADGSLAGTPTVAGSFAFTVTATNNEQPPMSGSQTFTINVDAPGPPVLIPGQTPTAGIHGTDYYFQFGQTGGLLPVTFALTQGAVPPGLLLGTDGALTGTPTKASATPYAFTVTITDSSTPTAATDSVAYTMTVSEPIAPTVNNTPPPTAIVGTPYSFPLTASNGLAPLIWMVQSAPLGGLTVSSGGILGGTPSSTGVFPVTLSVTDALGQSSPVASLTLRVALARPAASFAQAGSMTVARAGHTATLLLDGRVLIAGGGAAPAELYDPTGHTFTATGSMTLAQDARSAVLLANSALPNYGKVLFAGGGDLVAELFDPASGKFTATGNPGVQHLGQSATLLQSGKVLIAGGETAIAELFDPSTGAFSATGSMTVSRTGHTATRLPDGRVLITGGTLDFGDGSTVPVPQGPGEVSAELYDPVSGTFAPTGSMSVGRSGHSATLLADGTVLVTGADNSAEVFSAVTGTFSVAGAPTMSPFARPGTGATATLRSDGTVLIAGGRGGSRAQSEPAAELFAPESGGFVPTGLLNTARDGHSATLLPDGSVLVAGGTAHFCTANWETHGCAIASTVQSSVELFK